MFNNGGMGDDGVQRMTSLEIAELAGKQHKHVMEGIRRMEPTPCVDTLDATMLRQSHSLHGSGRRARSTMGEDRYV